VGRGGWRVVLLAVLASGAVACAGSEVLDRAADGRPILIRAPQPDHEALQELDAEHDLRTVVNLRIRRPSTDAWFEEQVRAVESIGARLVMLRISGHRAPTPEQLDAFFDLVEDPANWPILIHCRGGTHRTGVLAAVYRIQYQGWSPEQALEEMDSLLFAWTLEDREPLKDFVRGYRPDPTRRLDRRVALR
jgi:protein tyrosine/serine phosphatase